MLAGKTKKISGTIFLCFFWFCSIAYSQKFGFRHYGSEYGIPDGFVYTINQSSDGFLWIGTGAGLSKFDGYNFYRVSYPDSVESRNPYVSYRDNKGNIWFGCNDGSVFYTDGSALRKLNFNNSRSISQILQDADGLLYIIPQGGSIFRLDISKPDKIDRFAMPEEHTFYSATFDDEGRLMTGVQGSILILVPGTDTLIVRALIEGFEYSAITSICKTGSGYLAGTEDNGLFLLKKANDFKPERMMDHPEFNALSVRSVFCDSDGRIWVSTYGSGVIQFRFGDTGSVTSVNRYNSLSGLASDDVRLVYRDLENNYWFGMFGEGLSMLVSYAFGYYTPGTNDQENNILFVKDYGENYILGTPTGYHIFDAEKGTSLSFNQITSRTGGAQALSYELDKQGNLWIGTNGNGLYIRDPKGSVRRFYWSGDTGSDEIHDIEVDNRYIWLATTNGVVVLDRDRAVEIKRFGMDNSLPHNYINKLLLDNGGVYVGTESDRLYKIDSDTTLIAVGCQMTGSSKNSITAFCMTGNGTIWLATNGNGTFSCFNDSVTSTTRTNGLFSNFCYSILSDSNDDIWIGHEKGFSVIAPQTGIVKSFGSDYASGGKSNPDGMFESSDGKIFIGTTSGVIIYNSHEDITREIPPFNNITSIIINDKEYNYTPVITLPFSKYRITINYSGVNFSDPGKVYYSTYLENFDSDWSMMTTDRKVSYNLSDGKYKFNLTSVDENGLSHEQGASFIIQIARPLYKKWWFIALVIILIATSVVMIVREREKAHKKVQIYLESELEKRTSTIRKQKGEIELQNLEITDSINYAKRIQTSILPDKNKLKENFREAFILFHPRDIVSGDFYWFDKVDDEKFIVVCADSTGHGVPGAFMSMIGSTLLQDIVTRKKITRPSQVLSLLDKQVFSTLNQNIDLGVSNDGMDVVVCEFNIKSRHLRFASAMRPIILVISGDSFYIKGNRSSVGGESVIEKYFDDQEYYLNEGDTVYLFSDGLPDQFGGIDGKKMKIARLKKLIDQIIKLPMNEQEESILKFFREWKGEHEQVDDILIMGIRM
jgi:ligand-binding sensor domain-containing protein/serine phosphatase RsbU (regulator of sigma subunit)